ncbi:hypothetical protein KM1_106860 [Entamoeba histolytica HM-3:IMSS]|uniref:Uncharacterized protein n=1 Tax=Entamoeba histolytica HM-3:IMSS TaxID=885315 RepID=M7WP03_ENTHI|nr:hypothetical protein KM1_106860 [Entamoeba histolytica HM-3:IMSS]
MIKYITELTNKIMELDGIHSTYSVLKEPNFDDQLRLSFDVLGSNLFPMLSWDMEITYNKAEIGKNMILDSNGY